MCNWVDRTVTTREGSAAEVGVLEGELFRPWGKKEVGMSEAVERDLEGWRTMMKT